MKKTLILALTLVAGLTSARASNISLIDFGSLTPGGTVLSNPVTFANGASLPNGGIRVRLGYFNTAAQSGTWLTDLQSNDVARINAALTSFIPLGENAQQLNLGDIPTTAGPRTLQRTVSGTSSQGRLAGAINNVTSTSGTPNSASASGVPAGSRLFLLVYSDADATLGATEQFGVFSADNWLMPADSGLNPVLNTIDVDTATEVFRGRFGSLQLAAIPEPTTGGLALLAALGMLARRRR